MVLFPNGYVPQRLYSPTDRFPPTALSSNSSFFQTALSSNNSFLQRLFPLTALSGVLHIDAMSSSQYSSILKLSPPLIIQLTVKMRRSALALWQFVEGEDDDDLNAEEDVLLLGWGRVLDRNRSQSNQRGSVMGHRTVHRNREEGHERLSRDYFSEDPVYGPQFFRRRYRMHRHLFLRILNDVAAHDSYFLQRRNSAGRLGLSSIQKVTAVFRMLAYGLPADAVDEYVSIGASTVLESLKRFVRAVVEVYGEEYLRSPNEADTARLLAEGAERGFSGMLGSIDCMHWAWKNCPTAWQGQYSGHVGEPTIVLEAVASKDRWIWHAFFGMPGSHNDTNVLHRSPLFSKLTEGQAPEVNYTINGHDYKMGYYLADGIYPAWASFVKTIPASHGNKKKHFARVQEAVRKDVECAFGVLQARYHIVRGPCRLWNQEDMYYIMNTCVIMHNMTIEDERDMENIDYNYDEIGEAVEPSHGIGTPLWEFINNHVAIRDKDVHHRLQADLVEHLWELHSNN